MSNASHMQELRSLCIGLQKAADVPPPAVVTRQPPPPISSLPDMRINLLPLDQGSLWTEYNMFCRLLYRNKNQHRHTMYYQRLSEVKKLLAKWKTLDIRATLSHYFSGFDSMRVPMVAPSRPYTTLTIARLHICRKMISTIFLVIHRAYSAVRDVLSQRFFMAFTVLCMAMLSRFHSELIAVDELLSMLIERFSSFLPFCAPSPPSVPLVALLAELEPIAAKAPPPRIAPRTPTLLKKASPATATPTRPVSSPLDLGEPIKRTPDTEGKRPLNRTASVENTAKKLKSPQVLSSSSATSPAAAHSPLASTPVAHRPSSGSAALVGSTPPFVRSVPKTPISASFWTTPPAHAASSSTSLPSSPCVASTPTRAFPSPAASPSMVARPMGVAKPKAPAVPTANAKKVDDLFALLSGRK